MKPVGEFSQIISNEKFDFKIHEHGAQSFRFIPINEIVHDTFSLIIDQKVGEMLGKNREL